MNSYGIGTMSWIELLWTLSTTLGALLCGYQTRDALGDYRVVRQLGGDSGRMLLAREMLVSEVVSTVALALFAGIGVWASFTPAPGHSERPSWLAVTLGLTFVLVAVALTTNAALRRRWRAEYLRYRQSMARDGNRSGVDE